jgi:hypothetical protein
MYIVCWIEDDNKIWDIINTEDEDTMNEHVFYLAKELKISMDDILVFKKESGLGERWKNK